jgi:pyridoxine 4-dehydrogenase
MGALARPESPLSRLAERRQATSAQVALAWLLHRAKVMIPIPGTSSEAHLEENIAAAAISLSPDEVVAMAERPGEAPTA